MTVSITVSGMSNRGEPEPDYLISNGSYDRKFDTVGDFPYRCGPYPEMTAVVQVTD